MSFDQCIIFLYYYNIIQKSLTALKIFCDSYIYPFLSSNSGQKLIFLLSSKFCHFQNVIYYYSWIIWYIPFPTGFWHLVIYMCFLHALSWLVGHLFLAVSNISLSRYTSLFYSVTIEEHLYCFQILATMNKLLKIALCMFSCRPLLSIHSAKYQRAWLLDYMLRVCLVFLEIVKLSSKVAVQFCFTPTINESHYGMLLLLELELVLLGTSMTTFP